MHEYASNAAAREASQRAKESSFGAVRRQVTMIPPEERAEISGLRQAASGNPYSAFSCSPPIVEMPCLASTSRARFLSLILHMTIALSLVFST